jgi:haloacetate dehalogenase
VAERRAAARTRLHGCLRRPSRLWGQQLSGLYAGPFALCEAGYGTRHGDRDGATWIPAVRGCLARIERIAVLDVVPTETVWERADARFALAFWPWSLLAQPEPLPERILAAAAEAVVDNALATWGSPSTVFPSVVRDAYVRALREPPHAHAICEEYRAAATIDREHDKADRLYGRRIICPLLAMWSAQGALGRWYTKDSGPIALWQAWCDDVQGHPLDAGHFFPEEAPQQTTDVLRHFFRAEAR